MKFRKLITAVLACSMLFTVVGCDTSGGNAESTNMIDTSKNYIRMYNDNLSVLIDRSTGYVATIKNAKTGFVNKSEEEGQWPFYIEYQEENSSIKRECSIAKETNNTVSALRTYSRDGRDYLEITYDELVTDGKSPVSTGIGAVVTFSIGEDDEYFKFNVGIDMTEANGDLTALHLASGGDLRSGDGASEYLTAPVWGTGTKWKNPMNNTQLMTSRTLAYPGNGAYSLEAGWMDLSGENQGVGIAYINKQQLSTEFRFESTGAGMSIEVVLFDPAQILGKSVPLTKGEKFTSDDLVVSVHQDSWHKTADAYRGEYQKAFVNEDGSADYLTSDTISKRATSYRYFFRETCNYSGTGTNPDGSPASFKEMLSHVEAEAEKLGGIDYENTFLWLVGLNENTYGRDVPYTFPLNETDLVADEDKGTLNAEQSFNEYIKKGYIDNGGDYMLYTHPFAVDIDREEIKEDILPVADPQQHTESWNAGTHHSICIDNDVVMDWWKNVLIPEYKRLSPQGVQFDQGSLTQTVCDMEGHNHGLDAVSRLSSHNKAINELAQMVRDNLAEDAFILSEATNDITCRYIDIRQNHWLDHPPKWGGEFEYGAIMYTHPQYVYANCNFMKDSLGNVQNFFLQSAVLGGPVLLTDSSDYALKREYVRFANSLAENNVPGYPHGYKDDIGLSTSTAALFARLYVEGDKVSVLYSANANITNATITVDLEKLGFAGKGSKTLTVENMNGNTAAYQIIDTAA